MNFNLGFIGLCLLMVHVSVADPHINDRERATEEYDASSPVIKMTSSIPHSSIVGWKHFSYLQRYPVNFDVAFVVGPKKVIVRALKIALTSSSPVFEREYEGRWEQAVVNEDNGIPLPDLDPEAFKLFVELMILDIWSVDALNALELPSNQLLHLMSICHKYEMTTGLKNLNELAKDFLSDFGSHVKPEDFLQLSQAQLGAVLASDELPMTELEVYHYACSWAKEQCKHQNLEVTGKNMREVLNNSIYEIRFPTMSASDFANLTDIESLLTLEESVQIFRFLIRNVSGLNDRTQFKFKTQMRDPLPLLLKGSNKISLTQVFPVTNTSIMCNGDWISNRFNINMKIILRGLGFLGPIDVASFYNVTVGIYINTRGSNSVYHGTTAKRIFAKKSETFYFIFDQPIVMDPIPHDRLKRFYSFSFTITGPNTRSLQYQYEVTKRIYDDNNKEFVIHWRSGHMVEILYNTI